MEVKHIAAPLNAPQILQTSQDLLLTQVQHFRHLSTGICYSFLKKLLNNFREDYWGRQWRLCYRTWTCSTWQRGPDIWTCTWFTVSTGQPELDNCTCTGSTVSKVYAWYYLYIDAQKFLHDFRATIAKEVTSSFCMYYMLSLHIFREDY